MSVVAKADQSVSQKKVCPILIFKNALANFPNILSELRKRGFFILEAAGLKEACNHLENYPVSIIISQIETPQDLGEKLLFHSKITSPHSIKFLLKRNEEQEINPDLLPLIEINPSIEERSFLFLIENSFETFKLSLENNSLRESIKQLEDEFEKIREKTPDIKALNELFHKHLLFTPAPEKVPGFSIGFISEPSTSISSGFASFYQPLPYILDFAAGAIKEKGFVAAMLGATIKSEMRRISDAALHKIYFYDPFQFWREDLPSIRDFLENLKLTIVKPVTALKLSPTLFYGRFDLEKYLFNYIDLGYTNPIHYVASKKQAFFLNSKSLSTHAILGEHSAHQEISYGEGDIFIFHSLGVFNLHKNGALTPEEASLLEFIGSISEKTGEEICQEIKHFIERNYFKTSYESDFCLAVIKIQELCRVSTEKQPRAKFNSELSQLSAVRELMREFCVKAPGDTELLTAEFQVIIDEIFCNIIKHGYGSQKGFPIYVQAEYLKDGMIVEISDKGKPFNPHEVPNTDLRGEKEHGYGWYLVRHLADRIYYKSKSTETGWNHLRIFKSYLKDEALMKLTSYEKRGQLIVNFDFEFLDAKHVSEFKERLQEILDKNPKTNVIFNLEKLQFIDSAGLGAFLTTLRQLNSYGAHLSLAALSKPVRSIFELVSMQKIFECYDNIDQAISASTHSNRS